MNPMCDSMPFLFLYLLDFLYTVNEFLHSNQVENCIL